LDRFREPAALRLMSDDVTFQSMAWWMLACGAALVWLVMHRRRNAVIRKARAESEQARTRLKQVLQHSREALYQFNLKSREFEYLSPACFSLTGYTDREIRAMSAEDLLGLVHPDERARIRELMRELCGRPPEREGSGLVEYRFLHKDGEYRSLSDHVYAGFDAAGAAVRVGGSVREITRLIRQEDRLQVLERKLEESQKMAGLGLLASGIAHDFNNLMTVVLGNAELALLEKGGPDGGSLDEIKRTALRAAELANQMLVYAGKTTLVVSRINLGSVVREMGVLLDVSISKKVTIEYSFDDDLAQIRGDVSQIRQVAMNLITNASEAIGDRCGVISIRIRETVLRTGDLERVYPPGGVTDGRYVLLEVSDTGCGMDEQTRQKIFDPLFTTKVSGRGLGLAALLNAVRRHQGAVEVRSTVGKGSVFRVYFPVAELESTQTGPDDAVVRSEFRGNGTVLIADDEEAIRMIASVLLKRMGFQVATAADGLEMVDRYAELADEITCLLLDINMPNLSGLEAAQRIRAVNPAVPILFMSGYPREEIMKRCGPQPYSEFIKKPFERTALSEAIRSVLESSC
jgi:PAS domain S-box-containing protein